MAFPIVVGRPLSSSNESASGSAACGGGDAEIAASWAEVKFAHAGADNASSAAAKIADDDDDAAHVSHGRCTGVGLLEAAGAGGVIAFCAPAVGEVSAPCGGNSGA